MNKAVLYPALATGLATLTICTLSAVFKMSDHKSPSLPQSQEQVTPQSSSASEPTAPQVIKGTTFIPKNAF